MPIETMTYSSLIEDIRRYLDRGEIFDTVVYPQIPRFIMLAENRLAREAKILPTKIPVIANLISSNPLLSKPERWRETISFNISIRTDPILFPNTFDKFQSLYYRSYETVRTYWPQPTQVGIPLYYADYDFNHWIVCPTPDADYPVEILYYEKINPLSEESQTNLYTQNYPDLLLYACLLETASFLKDDARIATWQQMYSAALGSALQEQQKRQIDNSQQHEV